MNWFVEIFSQGSVAQTVLLLTAISIVGLALGRIKIGSFSLGSSFVFFAALAAGHFAHRLGIATNESMMDFAKNFGLIIFVYTLGLQMGPGFFSSLRKGGVKLNLSAMGVTLIGSLMAVIIALSTGIGIPEMMGLFSGTTTNTPAMIAAQQTVLDLDPDAVAKSHDVASAYAVGYPFSVLTVILCVSLMRKMFPESAAKASGKSTDKYTAATEVRVLNPGFYGKTVQEIVHESGFHFVISRLWRNGSVQIPVSDTRLQKNDHLMVICSKDDIHKFGDLFGREENTDWNRPDIDWNIIDKNLVSKHLRVTKEAVVGISLEKLKLRNKFGVNITRINRAGITLIPGADTALQFGDRLTVVGDEEKIKALGKAVGNEEVRLNEPRLIPILTGIFLGVLLGSIPIAIPGMSSPLKLGIAGGPIIMGILMGALGPKIHITTYTTRAANFMLRQMGITFFFASLGFSVGGSFVETVFCAEGLKWAGLAVVMAAVPFLLMAFVNDRILHLDFCQNAGLLCGSYTNPNALAYVNGLLDNDNSAEAYATVYPLTTFIRVFVAQFVIILLGL
ncbi:MAG: putative transporter [Bacteroidia bacterium]|nr:putative transporter [Bacteroidia bacterium]